LRQIEGRSLISNTVLPGEHTQTASVMALISLIAPLKGLGLTTGIRNNADSDTPHGGKCLV